MHLGSIALPKIRFACAAVLAIAAGPPAPAEDQAQSSLQGTWVMESAFEIRADGTRTTTYGEHPKGLLMVDVAGRYTLQIFRVDRPTFAAADKARGTPDE